MQLPICADLVAPIHGYLVKLSGEHRTGVGLTPERLTYSYVVPPEREERFAKAITKLLYVSDQFDSSSSIFMLVYRQVHLDPDCGLDQSEWLVQIDVSHSDDADMEIIRRQASMLLRELEQDVFG